MSKHELGQYFTTNRLLKGKISEFILNDPKLILEPSIGRGDLVILAKEKLPEVSIDMYEIDKHIEILEGIDSSQIIYGDFMEQIVTKLYDTIIGNPPYVRTKTGNLYIDFTEKCFNSLRENGELIFIVPSDFFKLTSASELLKTMMAEGTFTHVYHPHDEKLFEDASIDVIVFRYCKSEKIEKKTLYNDRHLYIINNNGMITFSENPPTNGKKIDEIFSVYVGLVSGKEDVFKNQELGNISVLNGENKTEKYIYIEEYPSDNTEIDQYLYNHKTELLERKIRNFNENNWFEWGAPRNISAIKKNMDRECIYIYNITRKNRVAFSSRVTYFGGNLIMLIPRENVDLSIYVDYFNSPKFIESFTYAGRFKIGHRQISNSSVPF